MTLCKSCQSEIFWARTEAGHRIPMNYDPDPAGRFAVSGSGRLTRVRMLRHDEQATGHRFTSHFATCPAAGYRKRRALPLDFGESPLARGEDPTRLDQLRGRIDGRKNVKDTRDH